MLHRTEAADFILLFKTVIIADIHIAWEVEPIRRFLLSIPVLLALVLGGCQNAFGFINARWISEISLVYQPGDGKAEAAPFDTILLKDAPSIKTMSDAMNNSKIISGGSAGQPNISMKLIYGDGYTEDYGMELGEKAGQTALLRSARHTGKDYIISVKQADKLRKLIYRTGDSAAADRSPAKEAVITVNGPVTLSRNELLPVTGKPQFLSLQLLDGHYSEDWSAASPATGRIWSGQFGLVVTDEQGLTVSTFVLSDVFKEEMSFGQQFQIRFGDYNDDGNPDFTIGQYGSSNGSFYKLFTLNKDNSIEQLHITGISELFISSPERYSVKLEEIDGGFSASYYDNALGKQVDNTYLWQGSAFQNGL